VNGTGAALVVSRAQVMAYRVAAQGFERTAATAAELAVLDLGVQDTPHGSAALSLAARLAEPVADRAGLTLLWSTRGAPHLHRTAELPGLAAALWPFSDADATARFRTTRVKAGGALGLEAFRSAAAAIRAVVTGPTDKGELSAGVSARIPDSLNYDCGPCQARHVSGALLQQSGLPAGVRLDLSGAHTGVVALPDWPGVPTETVGLAGYVEAYLRLLGPAGPSEVAGFLGTSVAALRGVWPADLVEVRVDGRRGWVPATAVDRLREADPAPVVRLLPPGDVLLQARDRDLLVPDPARQKQVWRILGNPGAVLADGEIAGVWRAKKTRATLTVTVEPFAPLSGATRRALTAEAERHATLRGLTGAAVTLA
jgi:hypothetical protein